jgi:hypothetical protein
MRKTTLMVIVGTVALLTLPLYGGVASAQMYSSASAIGVSSSVPFSLVKGGFGHGGFHFGLGFGGWPYYGGGYPYGYGGYYYDYPNGGTRTEPGKTCVWSGYEWTCYKFNNNYNDYY